MNDYSDDNNGEKKDRINMLKKRMGMLLDSISHMALMLDKNNPRLVEQMDEVCRQADEINREYNILAEDLDKFELKES
jgi:hypothetical protein